MLELLSLRNVSDTEVQMGQRTNFCTYRLRELRRLVRVCASQTHRSHRCSHTQSMDVHEGTNHTLDI